MFTLSPDIGEPEYSTNGRAWSMQLLCSMTITSFRELEAWQLAMDLVEQVYEATATYPGHERYGLVAQTRRAAVSVPSNVAEGHSRPKGAFLNHLSIALGSHAELETLLILAQRLGYLPPQRAHSLMPLLRSTVRCVQALHSALQRAPDPHMAR